MANQNHPLFLRVDVVDPEVTFNPFAIKGRAVKKIGTFRPGDKDKYLKEMSNLVTIAIDPKHRVSVIFSFMKYPYIFAQGDGLAYPQEVPIVIYVLLF